MSGTFKVQASHVASYSFAVARIYKTGAQRFTEITSAHPFAALLHLHARKSLQGLWIFRRNVNGSPLQIQYTIARNRCWPWLASCPVLGHGPQICRHHMLTRMPLQQRLNCFGHGVVQVCWLLRPSLSLMHVLAKFAKDLGLHLGHEECRPEQVDGSSSQL